MPRDTTRRRSSSSTRWGEGGRPGGGPGACSKWAPSPAFPPPPPDRQVDGLTGARGKGGEGEGSLHVKVELLQQIDGVGAGGGADDPAQTMLILGATNRPWDLDEAFRRRFQKRIFVSGEGTASV